MTGFTLDDDHETGSLFSPNDLVLDSADDDDDDEEGEEVHRVKVPFAVRPRPSSASPISPRSTLLVTLPIPIAASPPAMSDASADEDAADDDDEVADILLQAQRLGEQVARLEEADRDQQEMRHLIDSDSDSNADSDSDEVDGREEMVVVYF